MKKKIFKYILMFFIFFFFFLCFNLMFNEINLDEVWNYGFSYNIAEGLIPYKDFNMVITPLYPMFIALFLKINNSMLLFHAINALIPTSILFITYKLIKEKTFIILPLLIFPTNITFPNYNLFILLLFVLLIYLEKNKKSDLLIGLVLSLIFLTKQSIGLFLIPVSLYYLKDKKKIFKRLITFIIPVIIFTIYLLVTNSFYAFIDLCILGLFDFGKENSSFNVFFYITILLLIILLILMRNKKKIDYYYLLTFISICVPLFDLYHIQMYLIAYLIILFMNTKSIFKPKLIGLTLFIGLLGVYIIKSNFNIKYYPNKLNKFEYRYIENKNIESTNEVIKYMNKYNNKVMFIGPSAYYYKIVANQKINNLDLINTGNFGYDGSNKLLDKVKELDNDYVFFVKKDELGNGKQTDQNLIKYIIKNGKKIDKVCVYDIYRLGDIDD